MKIISWNVNGIRAVCNKELWQPHKLGADILCLQETKAMQSQFPEEVNHSKSFIHANSAQKKGYSGVATLSDVEFSHTNTAPQIDPNEGRILEHHFGQNVLLNVYFPNGQQSEERLTYKMDFYDKFLKHIDAYKKANMGVIVCGDVNTAHKEIDLKNPKANSDTSGFLPIERAWIDKLLSHGFIDTFRFINGEVPHRYSWWSYRANARANNTGWRIDYFFISENLAPKLKDAFILHEILGSDHCPVGIEIDI